MHTNSYRLLFRGFRIIRQMSPFKKFGLVLNWIIDPNLRGLLPYFFRKKRNSNNNIIIIIAIIIIMTSSLPSSSSSSSSSSSLAQWEKQTCERRNGSLTNWSYWPVTSDQLPVLGVLRKKNSENWRWMVVIFMSLAGQNNDTQNEMYHPENWHVPGSPKKNGHFKRKVHLSSNYQFFRCELFDF